MSKKSKSEQKREALQKSSLKKTFTFPAHGITIEAESMEEALEKLKKSLTTSKDG